MDSNKGRGPGKKTEEVFFLQKKVWSFAKLGGGGVSEGGEKTKLLF